MKKGTPYEPISLSIAKLFRIEKPVLSINVQDKYRLALNNRKYKHGRDW